MSFDKDEQFSRHKDVLLKPIWGDASYEGRFVITGSEFLQRVHGIDVIMQRDEWREYTLDTKHVRGEYECLYLEEWSCTIPGREKPGWIIKENGHPDIVPWFFWPSCSRCYNDCLVCEKLLKTHMYIISFELLRNWFIENRSIFEKKYQHHINETINRTSGWLVPVLELQEKIGIRDKGYYEFSNKELVKV